MRRGTPVLLCGVLGVFGCSGQSSPLPVTLGHVATLSGLGKGPGQQAALGIRLALEELTRGGLKRPIIVRHTDAAGQLEAFEAEAVRLVSINRVVAILGGTTAEEVVRLDRSRVPVISPCGMRAPGMGEMAFLTGLAPAFQGQVLARFVVEKGRRQILVLVDERRDQAVALAEAFQGEFQTLASKQKAAGPPPRSVTRTFGKEVVWEAQAERLRADAVAALVFAGRCDDLRELLKHWKIGDTLLIYAGDDGSFAHPDGASWGPVFVASAFVLDKDIPRTREFAKAFREAYQQAPDVHAAVAYDNLRMVAAALERAPVPSANALREELMKTKDFVGVTGVLTFAADGRLRRPAFVVRYDGSTAAPVKRYDP